MTIKKTITDHQTEKYIKDLNNKNKHLEINFSNTNPATMLERDRNESSNENIVYNTQTKKTDKEVIFPIKTMPSI